MKMDAVINKYERFCAECDCRLAEEIFERWDAGMSLRIARWKSARVITTSFGSITSF